MYKRIYKHTLYGRSAGGGGGGVDDDDHDDDDDDDDDDGISVYRHLTLRSFNFRSTVIRNSESGYL